MTPVLTEMFRVVTCDEPCHYRVAGGYPVRFAPNSPLERRRGAAIEPRPAGRERPGGGTRWLAAEWYTGDQDLRDLDRGLRFERLRELRAASRLGGGQLVPRTLTERELTAHFRGEHDVAVVAGSRARRLTLDVDAHGDDQRAVAAERALRVVREFERFGVTPIVQSSPSGGYHVDAFAPRPVPRDRLRALGVRVLERLGIDRGVDVFPAKGTAARSNGIRAPLGRGMGLLTWDDGGFRDDPRAPTRASRRCGLCGAGGSHAGLDHAFERGSLDALRAYLDRVDGATIPPAVFEWLGIGDIAGESVTGSGRERTDSRVSGSDQNRRSFSLSPGSRPRGALKELRERVCWLRECRTVVEAGVTQAGVRETAVRTLVGVLRSRNACDRVVRKLVYAWARGHAHAGSRSRDFVAETMAGLERLLKGPRRPHVVVSLPSHRVTDGEIGALPGPLRVLIRRCPARIRREVEAIVARASGFTGQVRGIGEVVLDGVAGRRRGSEWVDGVRRRPWLRVRAMEWLVSRGFLYLTRDYQIGEHEREYLIAGAGVDLPPIAGFVGRFLVVCPEKVLAVDDRAGVDGEDAGRSERDDGRHGRAGTRPQGAGGHHAGTGGVLRGGPGWPPRGRPRGSPPGHVARGEVRGVPGAGMVQ